MPESSLFEIATSSKVAYRVNIIHFLLLIKLFLFLPHH